MAGRPEGSEQYERAQPAALAYSPLAPLSLSPAAGLTKFLSHTAKASKYSQQLAPLLVFLPELGSPPPLLPHTPLPSPLFLSPSPPSYPSLPHSLTPLPRPACLLFTARTFLPKETYLAT